MKKILIIMVMLIGVGAAAQSTINDSGTGYNFNDSGTGSNVNDSGTGYDFNDSGTGPNIMLGTGGDSNSAAGTGGNQGSSNSELYQTPTYKPSGSSGVPKLSLEGIVMWLVGIMNQLVYVIIGAALVMFLYGILKLSFVDGQKPEAREQARKFMFWGIVSLFVMVSVWGLVRIFQFTLFGSGNLIVPQLK